jgi:hypothetical protein
MENKLTVFWIEDNPIQSNVERKGNKQYPKFLHEEFITYCLFQHPKQVEEYLSMICALKSTTYALAEKCQNALPDIIAFDYKMADAFDNNQHALSYYDKDHSAYLQSKSASHKLKETFEKQFESQTLFLDRDDVKGLEYGGDEFKEEFKAEEIQLDDEFGLYCGITIVREFKEYITVGVPATINKADKTGTMSYNSLFYEWINSYDLKGAIDRPANVNEMKDWSKILDFSAKLLRKRIETQIQTSKATPDYSQLNTLAEGKIPNERIFSFETIYGKRDLPLDGLFIDITDKAEQNTKIAEWANGILNKLPVTNAIIKKANETATTLWNTYLNEFEDRIVLSDYSSRLRSLNTTETAYLEEVKIRLDVNPKTGLIANECSIQTLLSKEDSSIIRLTTIIAISKAAIELEKQRVESGFNEKYPPLTADEYFNVLYPKANLGEKTAKTVLLPMNFSDKTEKDKAMDNSKKWLMRGLTKNDCIVKQGDIFQFEKWILKGEKEILKSLFYKDSKYFPQWLK